MAAIRGLDAVHISVVKRYGFPEPVFFPKSLKKSRLWSTRSSPRMLASGEDIARALNRGTRMEIGDGIALKPIRNPNTRKEFFWAAFKPQASPLDLGLPTPLPMFPFQALFADTEFGIDKSSVERDVGAVEDLKVALDAWLYAPGTATFHATLYFRAREGIDPLRILKLSRSLNRIPLRARRGRKSLEFVGFFNLIQHARDRLFARLLTGQGHGGEIEGYYVVYNLEGDGDPKWEDHVESLARLLDGRPKIPAGELQDLVAGVRAGIGIGAGRHERDLLVVHRRASVAFVEAGIRAKYEDPVPAGIRESLRCFRHHFLSSLELAYVTKSTATQYGRRIRDILGQLEAEPLAINPVAVLRKAMVLGPFKPLAYVTLRDSVLTADQKLEVSRSDGFWSRVFVELANLLDLPGELRDLKEAADTLFDKSQQYTEKKVGQFGSFCRGIGNAALRILEALKPIKVG